MKQSYSYKKSKLSFHKDIMNRENSTRLPYMQVEYIDDICYPLYKVRYCFWPQMCVDVDNGTCMCLCECW